MISTWDKRKARDRVHALVVRGKLPRASSLPCVQACGRAGEHYHHEDYTRPLDVVPVCLPCHRQLHARAAV